MARRRRGRRVDGWLVLDKPAGITSTRALGHVKRLLDAAKAGHAGTLDPLATGILPLAFGAATKSVPYVMDWGKSYRFTLALGEERDTDDAEGRPTATSPLRPSREAIEAALPAFVGEIEQVPPHYSAIKVDGERAYDLARSGRPPELAARTVLIRRLELTGMPADDRVVLEMDCGRGAHVRSIARDLGRRLGCLAHVVELRRTAVGRFDEAGAIPLAQAEELGHKGALEDALLPIETALADIPALAVTEAEARRLMGGQALRVPSSLQGTVCVSAGGRAVALATLEAGELKPFRVFHPD